MDMKEAVHKKKHQTGKLLFQLSLNELRQILYSQSAILKQVTKEDKEVGGGIKLLQKSKIPFFLPATPYPFIFHFPFNQQHFAHTEFPSTIQCCSFLLKGHCGSKCNSTRQKKIY